MNKTFAIIRREFIGRVRTRAFLISTIFLPVMMVFYFVVPALMMRGTDRTMNIALVDATTDSLGMRIQAVLEQEKVGRGAETFARYQVTRVAAAGRVPAVRDSLVALTGLDRQAAPGVVRRRAGASVIPAWRRARSAYLGSNASAFDAMNQLQASLSRAATDDRLERAGVNPSILARAVRPIDLVTTKVSDGHATGRAVPPRSWWPTPWGSFFTLRSSSTASRR